MNVEARGLSCSPCLQQGFRCNAYSVEAEGPVCVYHMDGDPCPHSSGIRVAEPASRSVSRDRDKLPAPPIDLPAPTLEPIKPRKEQPMPPYEKPKCNKDDCENQTGSATGFCAKHFYLSKVKGGAAATQKCTVCGTSLRRDNEIGLCKDHRGSTHAKAPKPKKSAKTNGHIQAAAKLIQTAAELGMLAEKNEPLSGLVDLGKLKCDLLAKLAHIEAVEMMLTQGL